MCTGETAVQHGVRLPKRFFPDKDARGAVRWPMGQPDLVAREHTMGRPRPLRGLPGRLQPGTAPSRPDRRPVPRTHPPQLASANRRPASRRHQQRIHRISRRPRQTHQTRRLRLRNYRTHFLFYARKSAQTCSPTPTSPQIRGPPKGPLSMCISAKRQVRALFGFLRGVAGIRRYTLYWHSAVL